MNKNQYEEFYVNHSLQENFNFPCIWVYHTKPNKPDIDKYKGLTIAMVSSNDKSCYVQVRQADKLYLSKFRNHITYSGEWKIFEDAIRELEGSPIRDNTQIIFLSEYYRKKLNIQKIKTDVKSDDDIKSNILELEIDYPKSFIVYIWYALLSCLQHPEMYARIMGITAIIAFFLALFQLFDFTENVGLKFIGCGFALLLLSLWQYYKCSCCYRWLIFLSFSLLLAPKIYSVLCKFTC